MLSALLIVACSVSGSIGVPVSSLHAPLSVERSDALAGAMNVLIVRVSNTGTGSATVDVSASEPYLVPGSTFVIAPGGEVALPVVARSDDYAPMAGTLTVRTAYQTLSVALSLTATPDWDLDGFTADGAGGDDCDDEDADVFPGAAESCNALDDDCDGATDDGAVDATGWFADDDDDGFGDPDAVVPGCVRPPGTSANSLDCDDLDASINPDALETLAGVDDDCDGRIDEDLVAARDLLVVELQVAPDLVSPGAGQFVELWNRSARDVQIGGFRIAGLGDAVVLDPRIVAAGAVVVYCADLDPAVNGGITTCAGLAPALARGDRVALIGDQVVDSVDYRGWRIFDGQSIELSSTGQQTAENDSESAWCGATTPYGVGDLGTPGFLATCP